MKYKNIIWDWNGTLFDDIDECIVFMNQLLAKYNLSEIKSRAKYQEIFCFPVKKYYATLGFNFNDTPFEQLAHEFITLIEKNQRKSPLFQNAPFILKSISDSGLNQHIISASQQESLMLQMNPFAINSYFTSINGLHNHYASSKVEIAKKLIAIIGNNTVFVGDTVHDWEVAQSVGCPCILIANGHQNKQILTSTSATVIDDIEQIIQYIL